MPSQRRKASGDIMSRQRRKASDEIISIRRRANFIVRNEQTTFHSLAVEEIMDQAMPLFRNQQCAQAEPLIRQALEIEPDRPDLLNNLAGCLRGLNRQPEATRILEALHAQFPDYLFACTALASLAIEAGEYVRAVELLEPLIERQEFHISEFSALSSTQIDLMLAMDDRPAARSWYKMWAECDPQNSHLDPYRWLQD